MVFLMELRHQHYVNSHMMHAKKKKIEQIAVYDCVAILCIIRSAFIESFLFFVFLVEKNSANETRNFMQIMVHQLFANARDAGLGVIIILICIIECII